MRHLALLGTLAKLLTAAIEVAQDLFVKASVLFRAELTPSSFQNFNLSVVSLDASLTPGIFEDVPDRFSALELDLDQLRCLSDGDLLIAQQEIDQAGPLLIADSLVAPFLYLAH